MISMISYQMFRCGMIDVPHISEDDYNWKQKRIICQMNKQKKKMMKKMKGKKR